MNEFKFPEFRINSVFLLRADLELNLMHKCLPWHHLLWFPSYFEKLIICDKIYTFTLKDSLFKPKKKIGNLKIKKKIIKTPQKFPTLKQRLLFHHHTSIKTIEDLLTFSINIFRKNFPA